MSRLTSEARTVLEEGRDRFAPSDAVIERLRDKILARAASSADDAVDPPPVSPPGAAVNRGWLAVAVAVGLAATICTTVLLRDRPTVTDASAPAETSRAHGEDRPTEPAGPAPLPALASPSETASPISPSSIPPSTREPPEAPSRPRAPHTTNGAIAPPQVDRTPPRAEPPATETDSLDAEMHLITAAQLALKTNDRAAVRKSLDEHERRFARGLLREERLTLRVRLLCAEGSTAEATRIARALAAEHPRSSHLASLRDSCVALADDVTGDVAGEMK